MSECLCLQRYFNLFPKNVPEERENEREEERELKVRRTDLPPGGGEGGGGERGREGEERKEVRKVLPCHPTRAYVQYVQYFVSSKSTFVEIDRQTGTYLRLTT